MMSRLLACALIFGLVASRPPRVEALAQAPADAALQQIEAIMEFVRKRNARDYAITTPNGIDEARFVTIGGIEQWITIRGEDRRNPVLLFLHGGPGDVTNPWGYAVFRPWLPRFTVVQWDQRGAGRTLGKSGPAVAPTITLDRMTRDGIEVAEYLRQSLGVGKVLLVGHSWGSILGVLMAKARPDLFTAFVGTGQVADSTRNYAVAYQALLATARQRGDARAIDELTGIGPPPYASGGGFAVQRKWSNLFEGADTFLASTLGLAMAAPGYTARDIVDWFEGQGVSGERLVPQTSTLNARALGGQFALPVFVIQGAEDLTTPTRLAREFVNTLRAPRKGFVSLEGGGHFAVFTHARAFADALAAHVLSSTAPR